jgi:hypothetical protein
MAEDGVMGTGLLLDYRNISGAVIADLLVFYLSDSARSDSSGRLLSILKRHPTLIPPFSEMTKLAYSRLMLANPLKERSILKEVLALDGVEQASLDLLIEDIYEVEAYYKLERSVIRIVAKTEADSSRLLVLWKPAWEVSTAQPFPRGGT